MPDQLASLADRFLEERSRFMAYVRRQLSEASLMDVEDIVADVLVSVFSAADVASQVENLTAYLYRAIANRIIDYRRRKRATVSLDQDGPDEESPLLDRLPDPSAGVEAALTAKETRECLTAAITALPPAQRAVWVATELQGLSFKELSRRWGEPVGTLLSRKSRATKALRARLQNEHPLD